MPERILGAFYAVFGYDAFTFMDGWIKATPTFSHYTLAGLVAQERIRSIVTLNFDLLLEAAWRDLTHSDVHPATSVEAALPLGRTWLHKPHGSLPAHGSNASAQERYGNIQFTIERIGTAPDETLIQWLQLVTGNRPLLVTGYSAGDIDVFPALCEARRRAVSLSGGHPGRVYWTHVDVSSFEQTPGLRSWLESLTPEGRPMRGTLEEHLGKLIRLLELRRTLPATDPRSTTPLGPRPELRFDDNGVLLAAALVIHSVNQSDQHTAEKTILAYLRKNGFGVFSSTRRETVLAQLMADRYLEEGMYRKAAEWYKVSAERATVHRAGKLPRQVDSA
jgi:hypothetical protein